MQAKVQDCGCIAIPEELVGQTGLHPGARIEMSLAPDGRGILIVASEAQPGSDAPEMVRGARCG